MNCRAFHDQLQRRLDGAPLDDGAYEVHRRDCTHCASLHAASVKLLQGFRLLTPPAPPGELAGRITAALLRRRRRLFRGRRVAIPLAVAACLLLAIGARLYWRTTQPTTVPPSSDSVVQVEKPPAEEDRKGLRESVSEASDAVVALTGRAADEAVDSTSWLLPRLTPPVVSPPQPAPTRSVETLQEAGEGVREGLAPVADSARRAVHRLLHELPLDFGDGRGL
jgi:hypothetical protein